ncbi:unnamed protein product [Ascophyllum nodosum]
MMGHDENLWSWVRAACCAGSWRQLLRTFYTAYDVQEKKVGLAKVTVSRTGETCSDDTPNLRRRPIDLFREPPCPRTRSNLTLSPSPSSNIPARAVPPPPPLPTMKTAQEASASSTNPISSSTMLPTEMCKMSNRAETTANTKIGVSDDSDDEPNQIAVAARVPPGRWSPLLPAAGSGCWVHRRIRRKTHRHTPLGGEGGPYWRCEVVVTGAEDDFLQARPGVTEAAVDLTAIALPPLPRRRPTAEAVALSA